VRAETDGSYVTVTAGPKLTERIINDLTLFDAPKKQVLLQSKVVVMEEGDLLNMGIEWSWPQVSAGLFASHSKGEAVNVDVDTGGKGIWGVQMGYSLGTTFTNALTMGLNLLKENDKAQMIANPSTMASDGKLATMSVMTEEYFMLTPDLASGQLFTQSELQKIESGVSLKITPYIADNNDIVMDIAVELSDSIPSGRASGLPVVTRRLASNTVRVMNGGSAVIAGLNENRKTIKEKRTPGLSNIPLIGYLFSNTSNDTASRDVAIFVTANVIKPERPGSMPARSAAPAMNPMAQPPVTNMNNYRAGNTMAPNMNLPGSGMPYNTMPQAPYNTAPEPQYNTRPGTQYNSIPNINDPGAYDSFQAELRRTIAEARQNNPAYN
jgi:general secretion pathway protein D